MGFVRVAQPEPSRGSRRRRPRRPLGTYGPALGLELGPDATAIEAQRILDSLPAGSGVNPITPAMQAAKGEVPVADPQYGGYRYDDYYHANPIPDPSGLLLWNGADSAQFAPGLSPAQLLAAQVLLAHGDTSWSADFHPVNANQYAAPQNAAPTAPATYDTGPTPQQISEATRQQLLAASLAPGEKMPVTADQLPDDAVYTALDSVARAGGDPSQPTALVDAESGAPIAVLKQLGNGSISVAPASSHADVAGVVQSVTGFIDKLAGTLQTVGTDVQKVGNAVKGAAAGAQAGYAAPTNWTPFLWAGLIFAGGALVLGRRH